MRLPLGTVSPIREMLPRLIAEESLIAMQRVAMGSGNMKEQDAKRIGQTWERMAAASQTTGRDGKGADRGPIAAAEAKR